MKKALSQLARECGVNRSTLLRAKGKYFPAEQSGSIWLVDDETPEFQSYMHRTGKGRPRGAASPK